MPREGLSAMTDQQIEGTTWTERDVDALLVLFYEDGFYPSAADCREARIVLNALRCDAMAKAPRARRAGIDAFVKLSARVAELRRKAERLSTACELSREASVAEVEAYRLAWARIRAVCLLVVWITRVTS